MKKSSERVGTSVWVIRAGKGGEANDLFFQDNVVALADHSLGDLRKLPRDRHAFREKYHSVHLEESPQVAAGTYGKFFHFTLSIQVGDRVLYPSLKDGMLYVGTVSGEYFYDAKRFSKFPHRRQVRWECSVPRSDLSEGARRELGAARTFFQYRTHVSEIEAMVIEGRPGQGDRGKEIGELDRRR